MNFQVQGKEFRAHRIILSSASDMFCKLFSNHLEPTQEEKEEKKEEKEEKEEDLGDIPEEFCCPISTEVMDDPVIAEDGMRIMARTCTDSKRPHVRKKKYYYMGYQKRNKPHYT